MKPHVLLLTLYATYTYSSSIDTYQFLTTLAFNSAIESKNAVKAQNFASHQASYNIKNNFASAAKGASNTARAALLTKQALISNLKQQLYEAKEKLLEELKLYKSEKSSAQNASQIANNFQNQVDSLQVNVALAQLNLQNAGKIAVEAAQAAAEQKSMLIDAGHKVLILKIKLASAWNELKETRVNAKKALIAAKIAMINASEAHSNDIIKVLY